MDFPKKLIFRHHAARRMLERGISKIAVKSVLETGEVIENYSDDRPFPSFLILGFYQNRPLHIVAAVNSGEEETILITVYEPDPKEWSGDFRERKN